MSIRSEWYPPLRFITLDNVNCHILTALQFVISMEEHRDKQNQLLEELSPKISIQEAFKKFQKEKFYQLKLNKYLQGVQVDRNSPEFKKQLRQKFVQTAHKYIGVPYAQKYHQPGDQLYSAPLFLDCCALIRQCVFDLRQEFGYTLGKWNQSYQFDLLPDEGLSEGDLKPGDLIFYSATYNNPKLKPFPHKMVHVEIYLGDGKSIGSRWQKGTIQVFDSYKFSSSLYHDIEWHYRSIDSWLQGKFISHCSQHKWLDERSDWLSDKFSVFADPSLDDINLKECVKVDQRSVFVGKGNNSKLVQGFFSERDNYVIMAEKDQFSPHFFLKWVQSTGEIDFHSFKEGQQIVNHIANISVITQKLQLLKTLKDLQLELSQQNKQVIPELSTFLPKTYRLDVMSDEIEFMNDKTEGVWIYKPRNLNQGRGIRLIADINEFKREFIQSKKFYLGEFALNNMIHYRPELNPANKEQPQQQAKYGDLKQDGLIQHYIKPLLINGKKFDIRCFLFINSNPSIALFHPGYLRLTIEDYSQENIEDEKNLMVHLTNNCFQNKHKLYKEKKEDTIGKWDLIVQTIGEKATNELKHKIKKILVAVVAAANRKLIKKRGTYELLGCDILVGHDLQPYLLEVNTNPAMFTDTKVQKELLPKLMRNTLEVVLNLFDTQDTHHVFSKASDYDFDLLYCENNKWVYGASNDGNQPSGSINGLQFEYCDTKEPNEDHSSTGLLKDKSLN